jgi:hypothetical protein
MTRVGHSLPTPRYSLPTPRATPAASPQEITPPPSGMHLAQLEVMDITSGGTLTMRYDHYGRYEYTGPRTKRPERVRLARRRRATRALKPNLPVRVGHASR